MSRKQLIGTVVSDKMEKTGIVEVESRKRHPVYHKIIKKRKKFRAHDEVGAKIGDIVKIEETRPLSKTKCWEVLEILNPKSEVPNKFVRKRRFASGESKITNPKSKTSEVLDHEVIAAERTNLEFGACLELRY